MYDFSILRELRKRRSISIATLSTMCGVSYVALSKLERNQGNPELRTLDRISRALGLPTHTFVALAEQKGPIQACQNVGKLFGKAECRHMDLGGLRILCVRAPKGTKGSDPKFHGDDTERCFVLDGKLKVTVQETDYTLDSGEGMAWDSALYHHYEVLEPASFIIVLAPKRP